MNQCIRILGLEDRDAWESEHSDGGLPAQSWSYAKALAESGVIPKLAIVSADGSRMLIPFHTREWAGTTDIATTFGLSGASVSRGNASAALALWHQYAVEQNWVAGYLQMNPQTSLRKLPVGTAIGERGDCYFIDLHKMPSRPPSRSMRRNLEFAERSRAHLIVAAPELSTALLDLYPLTRQRTGASARCAFSSETIRLWSEGREALLVGASIGDSIKAVLLFRLTSVCAESHLLGTTDAGRRLSAWLYWEALNTLRQRGLRWVNLGGGAKPGDGISKFKLRLGGIPCPLRAALQVYDQVRYEALCRNVRDSVGWFPPYRSGT